MSKASIQRRDIIVSPDSQLLFVVLKTNEYGDIYCSCNQAGDTIVHRTFDTRSGLIKVGELTEEQFTSMDYHTYKR